MKISDDDLEKMSRSIAMWHGQKMVYLDKDGMQTVASAAGYGSYGDSPSRFAEVRWREYTSAALFVIDLLKRPDGRELSSYDFMEATG